MKNTTTPKFLITTSRSPNQALRSFCNDLNRSIPNSIRINRGKSNLDAVAVKALEHEAEKIIMADRWKGGLGKIQLFTLGDAGLVQFHPIIYVKNVRLQKTFRHAQTEAAKSLILQTEAKIPFKAHKLAKALSKFFNIPKLSIDEAPPQNMQASMHISLNPTRRIQITFIDAKQEIEVGPRITVSHLIWKTQK
ncbi:hypothetical protein KAU88_05585 [Candidatus Bathyarchaeota archaeon]|nr:hypothetical protein [Candidatus Bathyarchaeota archaeon]